MLYYSKGKVLGPFSPNLSLLSSNMDVDIFKSDATYRDIVCASAKFPLFDVFKVLGNGHISTQELNDFASHVSQCN